MWTVMEMSSLTSRRLLCKSLRIVFRIEHTIQYNGECWEYFWWEDLLCMLTVMIKFLLKYCSANGTSPTQDSFTAQNEQEAHFDELGKTTQESEEVCTRLIEQLQSGLEESPNNVGLLWRISRVLTHLSMHKQKQEETEEEKQLLEQGVWCSKIGFIH